MKYERLSVSDLLEAIRLMREAQTEHSRVLYMLDV